MNVILVAGIGNIFHRDDAFGCEVIRRLKGRPLPEDVTVMDFGIRKHDLAYALTDGYSAIILVDAAPRGHLPGTLYLSEPDDIERQKADGHTMAPASVIRLARSLGGISSKLYLVGCEPEVLEEEDSEMSMSRNVREAIPEAVAMTESLIHNLLGLEGQDTWGARQVAA